MLGVRGVFRLDEAALGTRRALARRGRAEGAPSGGGHLGGVGSAWCGGGATMADGRGVAKLGAGAVSRATLRRGEMVKVSSSWSGRHGEE